MYALCWFVYLFIVTTYYIIRILSDSSHNIFTQLTPAGVYMYIILYSHVHDPITYGKCSIYIIYDAYYVEARLDGQEMTAKSQLCVP